MINCISHRITFIKKASASKLFQNSRRLDENEYLLLTLGYLCIKIISKVTKLFQQVQNSSRLSVYNMLKIYTSVIGHFQPTKPAV